MPRKVTIYTKDGDKKTFTARTKAEIRRSRGTPKRPMNAFAKVVKAVSRRTGLIGPALFKAAKKEYRSGHKVSGSRSGSRKSRSHSRSGSRSGSRKSHRKSHRRHRRSGSRRSRH